MYPLFREKESKIQVKAFWLMRIAGKMYLLLANSWKGNLGDDTNTKLNIFEMNLRKIGYVQKHTCILKEQLGCTCLINDVFYYHFNAYVTLLTSIDLPFC